MYTHNSESINRKGAYANMKNALLIYNIESSALFQISEGNSIVVTRIHALMEISNCYMIDSCVRSIKFALHDILP